MGIIGGQAFPSDLQQNDSTHLKSAKGFPPLEVHVNVMEVPLLTISLSFAKVMTGASGATWGEQEKKLLHTLTGWLRTFFFFFFRFARTAETHRLH